MPIDTRIEGDPSSIRGCADWLGTSLSPAIDSSVTDLFAVRDQAERGWQGDAGPAFHSRMDTGGRDADRLRGDVDKISGAFHSYADDLTTAQAGMERARDIARQGGLTLQGEIIADPGSGPVLPAQPPEMAGAGQVNAYNAQVTTYNEHQAKLAAYAQAETQAGSARNAFSFAKDTLANVLGDLQSKPLIVAAGFASDGIIGGLAHKHVSILKAQAQTLKDESQSLIGHYLKTAGGTAESKALNLAAWDKFLEADKVERGALRAGAKIEARLPVVGLALTAVDIGYDIHTGKPVGKAVISGVGGALAAAGTGAAIGTMVGGPVGTVAGAVIGAGVGMVTSGALDAAYDRLPAGTQAAIEEGFDAIGHGAQEAGEAVGDTAKKVWNSIF
ncbi:hypothetical protein [Mangrovihabitans endophyticus]|uniref:Uncharacterized protein n=1 Tax=Mangrovihabitans endophyticus TaxID=1751298 RepID=A0A8J3C869_9ACTN|nr:hypothetical protein [Mangrovihabitans endophyticus]GGL18910.1 hypothetical protein GCM10012284_61830 [Mangrovihabitans endophyticus]